MSIPVRWKMNWSSTGERAMNIGPGRADTLCGMRVRTHNLPPQPVLQITPSFPHCSDKFRTEWNAWALERFGTKEQPIYMFGNNIFANPRQVVALFGAEPNYT